MNICNRPGCNARVRPGERAFYIWVGRHYPGSPTPRGGADRVRECYHQRCWTGPTSAIGGYEVCFKCGRPLEPQGLIVQITNGSPHPDGSATPQSRDPIGTAHARCWGNDE